MKMEKHSQKQKNKKENYLASTGVVIISVKHTNKTTRKQTKSPLKLNYTMLYDMMIT